MVEGHERTPVRLHADFKPHKFCDLGRPRTGGIDNHVAGNTDFFSGNKIPGAYALHLAAFLINGEYFMMRQHLAAISSGGHGVVPYKAETVHTGIRHTVHGLNARIKVGLKTKRFLDVHGFSFDACLGAGLNPGLFVIGIVLLAEDEESLGFLNAFATDTAQYHIFFDAFLSRLIVLYRIATAAVQQAVEAGTCARSNAPLLKQHGLDSAHAEISQDTYASSTAADNDYSRVFHTASLALLPEKNFHFRKKFRDKLP